MGTQGFNLPPLLDAAGKRVEPSALAGKRVAYYFSAGWCPMCTNFEPALLQYCAAAESAGNPVSIIYVSSDRSAKDAAARCDTFGFLQVPWEGDTRSALKKGYKVWAGAESREFGTGRRSGVPALVVLDEQGKELAFCDAERSGPGALSKWPLEAGVW